MPEKTFQTIQPSKCPPATIETEVEPMGLSVMALMMIVFVIGLILSP